MRGLLLLLLQRLDRGNQPFNRAHRFIEGSFLAAVELDLKDPLDTAGANHRRHANIDTLDAILAVQLP